MMYRITLRDDFPLCARQINAEPLRNITGKEAA
jgi:hypothetical protein